MAEVYRNLHRDDWSVRESGRVVAHRKAVIVRDPQFVVQPAGRERVLRERRKNVHAFVRGEVVNSLPLLVAAGFVDLDHQGLAFATYNPYLAPYFTDVVTGARLDSATWAVLTTDGRLRYLPE